MQTVQFYVLDVQYKVEGGKAVIHLFGRTSEGKQICVIDRSFPPYFIAVPKKGADVVEALKKLTKETDHVVAVEPFKVKLLGKERDVLRVVVNLPRAVPALRELAASVPGVEDVYEYDILFAKRYLVDKGIIPLTLVEAQGTVVPHSARVPVFDAVSIRVVDETNVFEKPRALAIDIETYNPHGKHIDPEQHPIIMLALYGEGFQKVLTWKNIQSDAPYIERLESEAAVLERFKHLLADYKPDALLGYHSDGFDLPYIQVRAKKNKVVLDIGLDHSEMDVSSTGNRKVEITGIVHIDILPFIRRVIGRGMKTDSFTLEAVSQELLGEGKVDVDMEAMAGHWDRNDPELATYAKYNLKDTELTYRLFFHVLPNLIEMVRIVGMPMFDICRMSFSQFVEWFLIRQAHNRGEIILNRPRHNESTDRMQHRAQGAFVVEPVPGLYERISVFDFRSMYPSIIISHNISVETLRCTCCVGKQKVPLEGVNLWFCTKQPGFLSTVLKELVERRSVIKKALKTDPKNTLLSARSEALKVMANAFYGYLGFAPARWYSHECVESITAYSRSYIKSVIQRAEDQEFKVLYGDTDSVFLQLPEGKSVKDAHHFTEDINKTLSGVMELEFVDLYPTGLFVATKGTDVGAKKRYALMNSRGELTVKGFEIVRRNFSGVGKDAQQNVLRILLSEKNPEKALKYVRDLVDKLKKGKVDVEELVISTQLTKAIEEYDNIGPHVAAAQLMKDKDMIVGSGTLVRYVVVKGAGKIRDKVRLPDQAKPLDIDAEYYIHHQILPAVENIFAVFKIGHDQLVKESTQSSLAGFF